MTNYKQLAHLLKTGKAWITGKASHTRWPEYPHYWIITDSTTQTTHHVPCEFQPTWEKYNIY